MTMMILTIITMMMMTVLMTVTAQPRPGWNLCEDIFNLIINVMF